MQIYATSICIIPDADNTATSTDNANPYGTLLETTSIQYKTKYSQTAKIERELSIS